MTYPGSATVNFDPPLLPLDLDFLAVDRRMTLDIQPSTKTQTHNDRGIRNASLKKHLNREYCIEIRNFEVFNTSLFNTYTCMCKIFINF